MEFCTSFLGYFSITLHSVNVSFEPNVLFNITCIALYKSNDSKRWAKQTHFWNLQWMLFYLYFITFVIQIGRLILFLLLTSLISIFLKQLILLEKFCESMLNQSEKMSNFVTASQNTPLFLISKVFLSFPWEMFKKLWNEQGVYFGPVYFWPKEILKINSCQSLFFFFDRWCKLRD